MRRSRLPIKLSSDGASDTSVNEISAVSNGIRLRSQVLVSGKETVLTFRIWLYRWFFCGVPVHWSNNYDCCGLCGTSTTSANGDFGHKPVEVEMTFFSVVVARASRRTQESECSCHENVHQEMTWTDLSHHLEASELLYGLDRDKKKVLFSLTYFKQSKISWNISGNSPLIGSATTAPKRMNMQRKLKQMEQG